MDSFPLSHANAVVLAGGRSSRMGSPKAYLPWGGAPMLAAIVRDLQPLFREVTVVVRPDAQVPPLPARTIYDSYPQRGPLVGLASGLAASDAPWCFLLGCDMPFVDGGLIARMAAHLDGSGVVALETGGRVQPLHAFYSRDCLSRAVGLLEQGTTSLRALLDICNVKTLHVDDAGTCWAATDLDTPGDYARGLAKRRRLLQGVGQ